jgi:hypothetical protein
LNARLVAPLHRWLCWRTRPSLPSHGTRYCLGVSQENVELVRSVYADPRGLTAGASGKVAPDAEFDFSAVYPDSPIVRGVEQLRRFRDSGPWISISAAARS